MREGTIEPMRIKDVSTKNRFLPYISVLEASKTHNDIKIGNQVKTIIFVDSSIYSLRKLNNLYFVISYEIKILKYNTTEVMKRAFVERNGQDVCKQRERERKRE